MLYTTGIVGLGIYILILSALLYLLLKRYWEYGDALSIFSIIIFSAVVIDSMGLTMTLQPGYCWFSFGILSLNINRVPAIWNNHSHRHAAPAMQLRKTSIY
jgi:hypothetical protein